MILELKNPITKEYTEFKDLILSDDFPWYFQKNTTDSNDENFYFYSHSILKRGSPPTISSPKLFDICVFVLNQIFEFNNISIDILYRINLNCTHYSPFQFNDPHIDHLHAHKNILIYLNEDIDGNTIIFDKKYNNKNEPPFIKKEKYKLKIKKEIVPNENKILCFDGRYYHCHRFPNPSQRRVVLVATFR